MANFDEYFPFDPGNGATANSLRWRKMAQLWAPDGVLANYLGQLTASIAGSTVTVQTGAVFIHGYYAEAQNPQTITVATSGTIVAKVDLVNQICSMYYKDQAVDYGTNLTLNYEQSASNWEIPLWLVSSGSLIDLRTMVSPSGGLSWWNQLTGPVTVSTSATSQQNFVTARVPYAGHALLVATMTVVFSDASQAQSAICQVTYQYGASDQQLTPTVVPAISGSGPAGRTDTRQVSVTGLIPVTPGKKSVGWRVTAGTGPGITIQGLTISMLLTGIPAAA